MTIVNALHGRARMRRAAWSRLRLLALLLVVLIGLRALEADAFFFVRVATVGATIDAAAHRIYVLRDALACAAYIVAGIAYDRFGLKRGVALALLAWCALIPLATVADPVAYRVLSAPLTGMLPGFAIVGFLFAARLAWPIRRRAVVVVFLLILYERAFTRGLFHLYFPHGSRDLPATWQVPILVFTTLGALLFAVWWVGLREDDRDSGLDLRPPTPWTDAWPGIFSSTAVWSVLALEVCQQVIWHLTKSLRWEQQFLSGDSTSAANVLIAWATPLAALAAAWASDRLLRSRRDWAAARRPFVLAGFACAGLAPLLAALATQSGPALHIIHLVGLGLLYVTTVVLLDCVPRRCAGRAIGLILACESVVGFYGFPILDQVAKGIHGVVPLIALCAVLGAVLAVRQLPRLEPAAP